MMLVPKFGRLLAVFAALAAVGTAAAAREVPAGSEGRHAVQLSLEVIPTRYDIDVKVDPDGGRFEGVVATTIDVHARTKVIKLNSAGLSLDAVTVRKKAASGQALPARIELDQQAETATFTFADWLSPGVHVLTIRYHGTIDLHGRSGLYAFDYKSATGSGSSRMVTTQFQSADFRRFVPSWDEPDMKAVFALSVTAPAQRLVVSNTRVKTREELAGSWQRVTFLPTPKMACYLVFLGVGDWERVTRQVDGVEVGLVVPRGTTSRTQFVLNAASELLKYYNDYFGVKYPLAKLDFVHVPGSRGGMENWGAIAIAEGMLLVDPATAGSAEQQQSFEVIAHEMAHLWFGDLVTMRWWDELWLNEGFASWMEAEATVAIHPQWLSWLHFNADEIDDALELDARPSSHPIVAAVDTLGQTAFDAITYQKSAAVVRMIESYLGRDAFRAGIRHYMREHQYGNASTRDVFTALERASGKPVVRMGEGFVKQAGVPLLVVDETAGGSLSIRQERFGVDATSRSPREWRVPATLRAGDGQARQIVVSQSAPQEMTGLRSPVVVNADRLAYARTKYSAGTFKPLLASFAQLPVADQLTLLSDNWALAAADYAPVDPLLDLLAAVPDAADPLVWGKVAHTLTQIEHYLPAGGERDAWLAFGRKLLAPQLQRLGWDTRPGESNNAAFLRIELIDALSELGDPAVVAECERLVASAGGDPTKLASVKGEAAVRSVGLHANSASFEQLEQLAQHASDPATRAKYNTALSSAADPALAARALELARRDESAPQLVTTLVTAAARRNPDLAWQFATEHREDLAARLGSIYRYMFFPSIAAQSLQTRRAQELQSFAERFLPADAHGWVDQARAQIEENARLASRLAPQVGSWLRRSQVSVPSAAHQPVITHHRGTFNGHQIRYTATVEETEVADSKGTPAARLVSFAYVADNVPDRSKRPVMFVFNGGPITASVWLHIGVMGPKRLAIPDDPGADPSTFKLADNPYSPLDAFDLVLIDPASTGYSRVLPGVVPEVYQSVTSDGQQVTAFISQWLTTHDRLASPLYVLGESYGTIRAGEVAGQLAELPHPILLDGVILLGQAVNIIEYSQRPQNLISYAVSLPTLAALAWYHNKVDRDGKNLEQFVDEAWQFAQTDYLTALFKGNLLNPTERDRIAVRLEQLSGISTTYYREHGLRITKEQYRAELLKDRHLLLGRNDGRYVAPITDKGVEPDPFDVVMPAFERAWTGYLRSDLQVTWPDEYVYAAFDDSLVEWGWGATTPFSDWPYTERLMKVMDANPRFHILIANGYYDTQTTVGAAELAVRQARWPVGRARLAFYEGGHMAYTVERTAKTFAQDLRVFVRGSVR